MNRNITPLMAQYKEIKNSYSDCVLLFRVGDFYETFYEDAVEVSEILNIALTTRDKKKDNPVPLAGVPFHAAENYISRLLSAGKKVAVCEQVEDPSLSKGLVKREVVEVITPGTAMNPQLLSDSENNYCLAVCVKDDFAAASLIDVSTGDFHCGSGPVKNLHYLLQGIKVTEVICNDFKEVLNPLFDALGSPFQNSDKGAYFTSEIALEALRKQFQGTDCEYISELDEIEGLAAGALLHHCRSMKGDDLPQVVEIKRFEPAARMALDEETIANLELFKPLRGNSTDATLIKIIDHTKTPMGARKLRAWLQRPLADKKKIEARLEAVSELHENPLVLEALSLSLKRISDVERLASRIAAKKAVPRELIALKESIERIPLVKRALDGRKAPLLIEQAGMVSAHETLAEIIDKAIVLDPPGHLRNGGVIKKGFADSLDDLIDKSEGAKKWIAGLQARERGRTGISGLRVGYNRVFGYYIEVSKLNSASVPDDYIAKQTLVGSQRYYTQELKDREQLILEIEERRIECEQEVFNRLCAEIASNLPVLQRTCGALAVIDSIQSLTAAAIKFGYERPIIDDSRILEIVSGRHPVLEQNVKTAFVPNDLYLNPETRQFALLTGPNMSGKSTFLRQSALITIMAHMGSFVPADRATIGIVDKIFTRVGASDRLSKGQSTFLVEMDETAHILDNMTDSSLLLLDEIGRGTSTFDGLSIAWAVTEYVLQGIKALPKTLFATHFHELTQLKNSYPKLVNLKITIREWENGIIFLRKILPGTSERSFGIHAARVAGLPEIILERAQEILDSLETRRDLLSDSVSIINKNMGQYKLFGNSIINEVDSDHSSSNTLQALKEYLDQFDINDITPLHALQILKTLKDMLPR